MDIKYAEGNGANLSVAEQGMGTRSWISFLTLGAYITYLTKSIKAGDEDAELFVVLALEEPEAHLHSYAQKKLFNQIESFPGQKIISTHSANIVAQASIGDLIHLYKSNGKTTANRITQYKYICVDEAQDLNYAQYEVIKALCGNSFKNIMLKGMKINQFMVLMALIVL